MKATAPKFGGGGALESMFPGYKDKIWANVPSNLRRVLIQRENSAFEANMKSICVSEKNRISFFRKTLGALAPAYRDRKAAVDVRRQIARGTFLAGTKKYVPKGVRDRLDMSKAENIYEPFSAEEIAYRRKNSAWSISFLVPLIAYGAWACHKSFEPNVVFCGAEPPHPPLHPWWFKGVWHGHDIPSVRRGYEVYRKVCATCHSMVQMHFRHLVNEVLPEKRMKQIAASYDVVDGPNETGEMYTRPGILTDAFPNPYPNDEAGRYANGGALPPDLSVYSSCKFDGCDYIFAILTGYREPPVGENLRPGLYYNTYFAGGAISMPPPLSDEIIEYEDGTPATVSQLAKDVVQFITWTSEPTADMRKRLVLRAWTMCCFGAAVFGVWFRHHWIGLKTRRIDYTKAVF